MKKLAILLLLFELFLNTWPAKADTIVSGDLNFVCRGGCGPTFTAPTFSSFSYDLTDNQLTVEAVWDGITWNWDFQGLSQNFYQALTGSGPFVAHWSAWCITGPADIPPACGDGGIGFQLYLFSADGTVGGPSLDGISKFTGADPDFDVAAGTVTIHTPEPAVAALVLVGVIVLLLGSTPRWKPKTVRQG